MERKPGWRYARKRLIRQRNKDKAQKVFARRFSRDANKAKAGSICYSWVFDVQKVEAERIDMLRRYLRNEGKPRNKYDRLTGCRCDYCIASKLSNTRREKMKALHDLKSAETDYE